MKILFVQPRFHTNQIGWIKSLQNRGHLITMHVVSKGEIENYTYLNPKYFSPCLFSRFIISLFGSGGTNNPRSFPNPFSYFKEIKLLNPELIIVRDINRLISLVTLVISRIQNRKVLIYSQTKIHKKYSYLRKIFTYITLRVFNAAWISPIEGEKKKYQNIPKYIYFVPFAVNVVKKNININKPIQILTIGKFEKRKNHLLLLRTLTEVNRKFQLRIIGEVSKPEHREILIDVIHFINTLKLSNSVKIYINIPHSKIDKYYLKSDLFILPATDEHASISVVEALGWCVPTICSNNNGTMYYILDGKNGLVFEDNSKKSLLEKINYFMSDNNLFKAKEYLINNSSPKYSYNYFNKKFNEAVKNRYIEKVIK